MMSTASLEQLAALGRQRWLVALMAEMHGRRGARFVELANATGASRESLSRTIDLAFESGWMAHNPGHGHPLRPEYVLTETGVAMAALAQKIMSSMTDLGLAPEALTRWSLPLLVALCDGADRFNAMARLLAGATPRALSQGLKKLAANDLIDRVIVDGFPPASRYRLTRRGEALALCAAGRG